MTVLNKVDEIFPEQKNIQLHEVDEVMYSLWVSFHKYLGLQCEENSEPNYGYKFEMDEPIRGIYLGKAIRMRNKYAALVSRFGRGRDTLSQMTKDLTNAHIGAVWQKH